MRCRIWRTSVVAGREDEYESFAREISLPMFRAHVGFRGAMMARTASDCVVVTLWESQQAIDALNQSQLYRDTVQRIMQTGFLTGDQRTETSDIHLLALDEYLST